MSFFVGKRKWGVVMGSNKHVAIGSRGIVKNNLNVYIGVIAHRYPANKNGLPKNDKNDKND
ncbi:hypothetical protein [Bacillus nitratireducens]|uniref:hypothetical protein n=2 Tax=Bacillus nitratireducens TaxID=2026193 RepID=UPI000A27D7E7|nr:hypothetical protein [Bacillus nitratireducens]OSX92052.1 hypothetical protein BTJ45_02345 [Bacillus mycoides]PDY23333.1 hypothetical protein COM83_13955 [Bacillus cereus]PFJ52033.1 hypothetical protein COI99_14260 [Bacillus cereus]PFW14131.1 hypothetical protein COL18_20150 [Bacillus cereus]PGW92916.1 hypothetical protein COE40_29640 [Bacillus cereus]